MVRGELGYLEKGDSDRSAEDGVREIHPERRVEHLHLASRRPAIKSAVRCHPGCCSRILDHSSGSEGMPYFPERDAIYRAIDHYHGYQAGKYDQDRLEGIDVYQALDTSHDGIKRRYRPKDDDGPHQETEMYVAEEDYRHCYGGDEQPGA